jgi:hypothetical protein
MPDEPTTTTQEQPAADDVGKATKVAEAGATAAAAGEDAGAAMRAARDKTGLAMSDDDIEKIAKRLNELQFEGFEARGIFDPPPEPVQPPQQPVTPPPAGEEPAPPVEEPARQKLSPAARFFGET